MHRFERALRWPSACDVVYIDFDRISMLSVVLDLCEELVDPLSLGRGFVVLCSDADRVAQITRRFPDPVAKGQIRFIPAP